MRRFFGIVLSLLVLLVLSGCDAEEAPRIELQVVVDGSQVLPTKTDLGYTVELNEARMVVSDLLFTVRGEAHAAAEPTHLQKLNLLARDWLIAPVYAHPGHYQGGEISGEMPGRFVVDWLAGDARQLGTATLLIGNYESVNFTFEHGSIEDSLAAEDRLLGMTAVLGGVATRDSDGEQYTFVALIKSPQGRDLIGAPFEQVISESSVDTIGFRLVTTDPYENKSLFDGIDFADLSADGELISLSESNEDESMRDAYFRLRRAFQTHDHFEFVSFE